MNDRIAVVAGGSGYIGREIVNELAEQGCRVISVSKTAFSPPEINECIDFIQGDMTSPAQINSVIERVVKQYGHIDILINTIGKNINCELDEITDEIWSDVINSNMKSVFFLCKIAGKEMQKNSSGIIINFASTAGIRALPQSPHYIAAKAGVIAMTQYFAKIYAPLVRVNCIAPGFVLTKNHKPESYASYEAVVQKIPMKRMAPVNEVVNSTIYLIDSPTITGHTLVIDGGLIL